MNQAQPAVDLATASLAEHYLTLACERSPVIARTLQARGQLTLDDYLRQMLSTGESPLQPRSDLLEAVYRYAAPLLGRSVAERAALELEALPVVLTANHHGVDFLAQSTQGGLIFCLREVGGRPAATVPVFACGNVALNNPSYPRGLLLYHDTGRAPEPTLPLKLPVFPDQYKRQSVSAAAAYDNAMLARTEQRVQKMLRDGRLTPASGTAVSKILAEDYRSSAAMGQKSYSQQAVVLNNRIWKRCFNEPEQAPEMVYLELEKMTSMLLQADLNDENSLVWQILFNATLRAEVLKRLDGTRACWTQSKLAGRLHLHPVGDEPRSAGCGTVFFWAVDESGWRIPLYLRSGAHHPTLHGRDDRGNNWAVPFDSRVLLQGLQAGRLLPSLFTCFATIGFARGIACCGGYYQGVYLAQMQRGLAAALHAAGSGELAERLSQVPDNLYLSGMQAVMHESDNKLLLPAGPVEMVASGGLTAAALKRLRKITVRDAHLAGLMETLPDMTCRKDRPDNWRRLLAEDNHHGLRNRVVVI